MKIIKSDQIKESLIEKIGKNPNKKILILSQSEDKSVGQYKNSIIKRCKEFDIQYDDIDFAMDKDHFYISDYVNSRDDCHGFILLLPLADHTDLSYLRANIKLRDLDGFTYDSLGKIMNNDFTNLPQTARSVVRFLEYMDLDLAGKDIVIANSNNVIGRPLAMYLNAKKATVTLFNSKTEKQREKIKRCDIFITAIGKASYYDKSYFKDGQVLIDVGVSFKDGKLKGDIDSESLEDLDVKLVTSRAGVGSITTLSLLETLVNG